MKKLVILIIAVAVALMAPEARATVNSNWVVKDKIKYYFQTDKAVYVLGENVEMLYRVTNLRDTPVTFWVSWQECSFRVRKGGTNIIVWRCPKYTLPASRTLTLWPRRSKQYVKDWNMTNDNGTVTPTDDFPVDPGIYDVYGVFNAGGTDGTIPEWVSVSIKIIPEPIEAVVDIEPNVINLKSKGKWITCYIRLDDEEYNVADIDPDSVRLEDEVEAEWIWFNEEDEVAMAKFSRAELREMLEPGEEVELTVTGELTDGTPFEGTDVIKVIDKGRKSKD